MPGESVQGVSMAVGRQRSAITLDLGRVLASSRITLGQYRRLASAGHRLFAKGASTPRAIAQSRKDMVL